MKTLIFGNIENGRLSLAKLDVGESVQVSVDQGMDVFALVSSDLADGFIAQVERLTGLNGGQMVYATWSMDAPLRVRSVGDGGDINQIDVLSNIWGFSRFPIEIIGTIKDSLRLQGFKRTNLFDQYLNEL